MRKIAAYLFGVFLLLMLGSVLLHPSLLIVGDWLGPILGNSVYEALTLTFLLLGDPLKFVSLLVIWVSVALVCGAVVRRRLGAVLIALLVWLTLLPITAAVVFDIAQKMPNLVGGGGGGPLGGLPPIPSGLTLTQIFDAPIVGKVFEDVIGAFSSEAAGQEVVGKIIGGLAVDLALKPVIMIVGALIGVEFGRLIQKRYKGNIVASGPPVPDGGLKPAALMIAVILLSSSLLPTVMGVSFGSDAYTEGLAGFLDKKGRAYIGGAFVDANPTLPGIDLQATDSNGLAAAVVVSSQGFIELARNQTGEGASMGELMSLVNLLPPTFAAVVYLDVPQETVLQRSQSVAAALGGAYGVDLFPVTALSMRPGEGGEGGAGGYIPQISFAFYVSQSGLESFAGKYLDDYAGRGGFADTLQTAVENGRLIPGKTPDSASGSLFFAGFVNVDTLTKYYPKEELGGNLTTIFGPLLDGPIGFAGSASYWEHGTEPSGGAYVFDILSLLGAETPPSYSADSDLSALLVAVPPGEDIGGAGDSPNVKLSTSVPLAQEELDAVYRALESMGYIVRVKPETTLSESDFRLDLTGIVLPLNVEVTKTVTPGSTSTVTVTIKNNDIKSMTDVTLNDSNALSSYSSSIRLVSGDTEGRWAAIAPGETKTITYSIQTQNPGTYSLEPAALSYSSDGQSFRSSSNLVEFDGGRPSPLLMPFELLATTWGAGKHLLDFVTGGNGFVAMAAVTLIFLALIAWEGVRSYRRWSKGKLPTVSPQAVS